MPHLFGGLLASLTKYLPVYLSLQRESPLELRFVSFACETLNAVSLTLKKRPHLSRRLLASLAKCLNLLVAYREEVSLELTFYLVYGKFLNIMKTSDSGQKIMISRPFHQ